MRRHCNCRHPWCWLDTACHRLHVRWGWVCDKHDDHILSRCGPPDSDQGWRLYDLDDVIAEFDIDLEETSNQEER